MLTPYFNLILPNLYLVMTFFLQVLSSTHLVFLIKILSLFWHKERKIDPKGTSCLVFLLVLYTQVADR